jgi:hypothetical protein
MADPNDKRGISNRGVNPTRERNVPRGNVVELVPGRLYNVVGFDIGSADWRKPGIKEGLGRIVEQVQGSGDPRTSIVITGHASESQFPGRGPERYEHDRAAAIKQYLVAHGVSSDRIRTTASGRGRLSASAYSPEQKAAARAATVEIVPSKESRGTDDRFVDTVRFVKGEPRTWPTLRHIPDLGPLLRRLPGAGRDGGAGAQDDDSTKDPERRFTPWLFPTFRTPVLWAAGIGVLAFFFDDFVIEAGLEYGADKVAKYVKDKITEDAPRNDNKARRQFMAAMLSRINTKKNHPLAFLVDPLTGEWRSRLPGHEKFIGVQGGHSLSYQKGKGFGLAVEDAELNQVRNNTIETPGGIAWSPAIKIDGVPVEKRSAVLWEGWGLLKPSALKSAKRTVGWIDF